MTEPAAPRAGFIVLCCGCGRSRGRDGVWEPLEPEVDMAGTTVSHGVCPDCLKKLYGDEEWYAYYMKNQPGPAE